MAAQADDPARTELALRSIEAILDELPSLADDWTSGLSLDEQIAWSLEWGNEMAKLRRLGEADATGHLDQSQSKRFRTLAERAVRALPLVEQINFRRPDDIILAMGRLPISS